MKETGTTHWQSPNMGTNESGFTALPSGYRRPDFDFHAPGTLTAFWSSSEYNNSFGSWFRGLSSNNHDRLDRSVSGKDLGYSVRCLRD